MTVFVWPSGRDFAPKAMEWHVISNSRSNTSPLSGFTQTGSMPGSRWGMVLNFGDQLAAARAPLEAFLTKLNGQEHRIAMWDMGPDGRRNGMPRGTVARAGVTLAAPAAQFAQTLQLVNCGAGATFLESDSIGVGGQLLKVVEPAMADVLGAATVVVRHSLRQAAAAGAPVMTVRPTARFILSSSNLALPRAAGGVCPAFSLELTEVFV